MEDNETTIKKPTTDLSRFSVVKNNRGSNRGLLLERFQDRLNRDREAAGYAPYSLPKIGTMLAHMTESDLDAFYKDCDRANIPFGAAFHCGLKPKSPPLSTL